MKITQISVECKLSKNYNTFTVGFVGDVNEGEDAELLVKELQTRAKTLCLAERDAFR